MPPQPWRKLLYIPQPYPDNYTDASFLSQLKRNTTVTRYSYYKLVTDFSLVSLQLTTLEITHIVFLGLYSHNWDVRVPLTTSTITSILLYLVYNFSNNATPKVQPTFKSSLVITLTILTLSPVLRSLSESTSSDSIWSLSFWLLLLNTITRDYHFDLYSKDYNPILSTNILIAEVIVLASRFDTTAKVFGFMLFAIQIHGLFPLFDTWLRKYHVRWHYFVMTLMFIAVNWFIYNMMGVFWMTMCCMVHVSVLLLSPIHFLMLQKYKDELQGPWDPAKPIFND